MTQQPRTPVPSRYQIPTHLNVEDKIISFGGIGLTMRQSFLLMFAGSLSFSIWQHLTFFANMGMISLIVSIMLTAIPLLLGLIVAFYKVQDRPLESWLNIVLRYWMLPKVYIWQKISAPVSKASARSASSRAHHPLRLHNRRGNTQAF